MRICSLSPSATEILCALGLAEQLVGVSHRCDRPAEVVGKPVVSQLLVRQANDADHPRYELDAELVRTLRPELIVTQEVCDACAVPASLAEELARGLVQEPRLVSVTAATLEDVLANIGRLGTVTGRESRARALLDDLRTRIAQVAARTRPVAARPRIAFVEWLDPLWIGGNWITELIELAGGHDALGRAGVRSAKISWTDLVAAAPDVVLISLCGLSIDETLPRLAPHRDRAEWQALPAVRDGRVLLLDGRLYSRYVPRLVDGLEALARALHPDLFPGDRVDASLVRTVPA